MLKTQEERQGAVLCPDDRRGGTIPRAVRVSEKTDQSHNRPLIDEVIF